MARSARSFQLVSLAIQWSIVSRIRWRPAGAEWISSGTMLARANFAATLIKTERAAMAASAAGATDSQAAVAMPQPLPIERRRRVRRSYPYTQKVAPIVDGRLPQPREFVEVLCHDIAAGGFSFFADGPPVSDALVVALGSPSNPTFLTAQVAHVTRLGHQPKARYLVGCTYTGRASY